MRVLLKWNNKLIAAEIIEVSVCNKDDYCIELPDNVIVLHLLCAQRYEDCEEGHWNFQIFCKSKEQAESIVRELYLTGMADLTVYEKYTFVNLTDEITDEEWERINEIHKEFTSEKKTAHFMDKQNEGLKPDWERENREKYAWEE